MKVTVADCLSLDSFRGAEVKAGKLNLSNDVKAISVLDACDASDIALRKGDETEILLTGFLASKDDVDKQCKIVEAVAKSGCAALCVYYVGKAIKAIDGKVVATAEKEDLPLIIMSKDAEYSSTITEVMDKVLYGDKFSNSLISNTVFHLLFDF